MRSKLMAVFLALLMLPMGVFAQPWPLPIRLSPKALPPTLSRDAVQSLLRRQIIESPYGKFLIIVQDPLQDFVSRNGPLDVYIYILKDDASWGLIACMRTDNYKFKRITNDDVLLIVGESGNPVMSIPLDFDALQSIRASTAVNSSTLELPYGVVASYNLKDLPDSIWTKQRVEAAFGSFLIITHRNNADPAYGDTYVYFASAYGGSWYFMAYIKLNDEKLSAAIKNDTLVITKKSGEIAASLKAGRTAHRLE